MKTSLAVMALLLLVGCGNAQYVGSIGDPYCAPDGSVVYVVYPNTAGMRDTMKASRKNCPWYKGQ